MSIFSRVIALGNLTREVEVKLIQSGTAVAELGLAVNYRRTDAKTGEWGEETKIVDVTLWGRAAEIAGEYLSKGTQVIIEGHLRLDTRESDGQKRSKLRVIGETLKLAGTLARGSQSERPQREETPSRRELEPAAPPDDEIPF